MKEMVKKVPLGSCPKCGHKQFVVAEHNADLFLTNRDGEIIDSKNLSYLATGKCINCGVELEMMPTNYGFIPLSPIRKIIMQYDRENQIQSRIASKNPMQKEEMK